MMVPWSFFPRGIPIFVLIFFFFLQPPEFLVYCACISASGWRYILATLEVWRCWGQSESSSSRVHRPSSLHPLKQQKRAFKQSFFFYEGWRGGWLWQEIPNWGGGGANLQHCSTQLCKVLKKNNMSIFNIAMWLYVLLFCVVVRNKWLLMVAGCSTPPSPPSVHCAVGLGTATPSTFWVNKMSMDARMDLPCEDRQWRILTF